MASFLELPCEVRVHIYNRLLEHLPSRYGYTSLEDSKPWRRAKTVSGYRQHGLILANRILSSEYSQAYYNRTSFFFLIDRRNLEISPFWILSPALLPNLRQCQIIVDLPSVKTPAIKRFYSRLESLLNSMLQVRHVQLMINKSTDQWDNTVVWMTHDAPLLQEHLQKLLRGLINVKSFILSVKEYEHFKKVNGRWEAVADSLINLPT